MPSNYELIRLVGGLDLVTSPLSLKPGYCADALNFEAASRGGYQRVTGFERFDGRPSPSAATVTSLKVTGSTSPALASSIVGATSGATGVLIAQTSDKFFLTKVVGTYTNGELLKVSGVTVGTFTGITGPDTIMLSAQYRQLAANVYRADIAKPTGDGPVRGAFKLGSDYFCFRDNVGATSCVLYKASSSGWVVVPYFKEVSFTAGGTATPVDGATLTQGGVTATVKRVMTQGGASGGVWGGTAYGRFIITNVSGGNFAAGAATLSGGATCTLSGIQTQITQSAGGVYQFRKRNFFATAASTRMYGCDGVNRAFEFDGETFAPIDSKNTPNTPKYIEASDSALFLSVGSVLIYSAPNNPYWFSATDGAGVIGCGDNITGLNLLAGSQTGNALVITSTSRTSILYGTSQADFRLVNFSVDTGSFDYSLQNLGKTYQFGATGIYSIESTQNFGNFTQSSLTSAILPFIQTRKSKITCSCISKEKDQYRVYFNDGYGLYLTIVNNSYLGAMPIKIDKAGNGGRGLFNVWSGQDSTGDEVILGCGYDGYVYLMETGTSADGDKISAYFRLAYNNSRGPRNKKRYRGANIELQGSSALTFNFGYTLAYGDTYVAQPIGNQYTAELSPSRWDEFVWDSFFWDGTSLTPSNIFITGHGQNISMLISSNSDYSMPFTVNSIILRYSELKGLI